MGRSRGLICGTCSECCRGPRELELLPQDQGKYQEYEKGGKTYLARKENQDCVYLDGNCSIYEDRPVTCRKFDCRDYLGHPDMPARIAIEAIKRI